jgi:hypothetical protein
MATRELWAQYVPYCIVELPDCSNHNSEFIERLTDIQPNSKECPPGCHQNGLMAIPEIWAVCTVSLTHSLCGRIAFQSHQSARTANSEQ